jgi:hypothetical protein
MNFDDQIRRYFGTADLSAVPLDAGIERVQVDLGLTSDRGERFALWALLHTLGASPDLDAVFKNAEEREAARNFMDLMGGQSGASVVGAGGADGWAAPQPPLTFVTTFGAFPAPCEVTSVVRVQVFAPLLVETTVTLCVPAGALP